MSSRRLCMLAGLALALAVGNTACTDHASITDSLGAKKDNPGPPDDKGGSEGASNNLTFPVIWSDGVVPADFQELAASAWQFAPVADPLTDCIGADGTQLDDSGAVPDEFLCYYGPRNLGLIEEGGGGWNLEYPERTWWLQERLQNRWQMFHAAATSQFVVSAVDFGDLLESANLNQKQVRTEVSLLLDATTNSEFSGYIAFGDGAPCTLNTYEAGVSAPDNCFATHSMSGAVPGTDQSINEVQGTEFPATLEVIDPTTVKSAVTAEGVVVPVHATVYPRCSRLLIQRVLGEDLVWSPDFGIWGGTDSSAVAVNLATYKDQYSAEINAGGSMIFGFNWKTKTVPSGTYRLTFVIDGDRRCTVPSQTVLDATTVLVNEGQENHGHLLTQADLALLGGDEGGIAYIDVYVGQ